MAETDLPVWNRRQFLGRCAGAACAACTSLCAGVAAAAAPAADRPKVRLVFTHPPADKEGWPYLGYDHGGRKTELTARLRAACPGVEFLPATVPTPEAGKQMLEGDRDIDGYLVYITGIPASAPAAFAFSGRPAILVDDLYGGTGTFLGTYAAARRKGFPVAGVSSSDFNDVAQAARTFEVIRRLRSSVILNVAEREPAIAPGIRDQLGVTIRTLPGDELNAAFDKADRAEGRRWAKTWTARAEKIVEPSAAEVEKSGAMYVAMRGLVEAHKAQGIAVDCLRLFYSGRLRAYPCLGFFQMNDDGLVGACEADVQSAATMLVMSYLVGRPGYISDPVIDTSKNQAIYAHCVAPSKVFGPAGPANPFHIRSHSEDRKGAAIRSLMPLGHMTTTLKFLPADKAVVVHQGRAVANIDDDKACRTKLAVEVKDARKLMADWAYGWHRVTVYGDVKARLEIFSHLTGIRVIEEG